MGRAVTNLGWDVQFSYVRNSFWLRQSSMALGAIIYIDANCRIHCIYTYLVLFTTWCCYIDIKYLVPWWYRKNVLFHSLFVQTSCYFPDRDSVRAGSCPVGNRISGIDFPPFSIMPFFTNPKEGAGYGMVCHVIASKASKHCLKNVAKFWWTTHNIAGRSAGRGRKVSDFQSAILKPPRVFLIALLAVSFCPQAIQTRPAAVYERYRH